MTAQTKIIGSRVSRLEALQKSLGVARYTADLDLPSMVHGAILTSPYAHARIVSYDISHAMAAPGVRAVISGMDCPDATMGPFIKDEHAIAKGKVRFIGEPVAAVAADLVAQARAACAMINIAYEELPAVFDPQEALASGAPIIHEHLAKYPKSFDAGSEHNRCCRTSIEQGDLDAAWAACDIIIEDEYETPPQAHLSMEPCAALADVDPNGRVTLWWANQSVFRVQANVCESLGLPMTRLRCLTPSVGGGFGNKMEAHVQPIVVMLALKAQRPVKLVLTRTEDFEIVRGGHPFRYRVKTGAKKDGTLIARAVDVTIDGGAYADDSPGVLAFALRMSCGPYRFQAARAQGVVAYTNKLRFGAFRGFGQPQIQFGCEQQIDRIAEAVGVDPLELRRRNALKPNELWFGGQPIASNGLQECIDRVEADSDWKHRSSLTPSPGRRRGMGMGAAAHISALLGTGAIVRMLEDGTVVLNTGATDIGQGSDTVLAQICAEGLQIGLDKIAVASPDTDGSPYNWGTTASRVTYTTGRAVAAATAEVLRKAKEHASEMLECAEQDLELRPGGKIGLRGVQELEVSFADISRRAHWRSGGPLVGAHSWVFSQDTVDPKRATAIGNPAKSGVFSFGALVVDVEVESATGKIHVLRAWSAVDAGRAINPQAVEGQIEGAFVQGMGFALTEEMVWDGGHLSNPSMMDYKAPTSADAPYEINSIIVEAPEPDGPYGAKGVGEIGMNVVAAAIANAVAAATGARLNRLPLTPERVLRKMLEGKN